uniref:Uncharacterized protein n=1 Tax=Phage sp. ctHEp8 TaxID=2825790 RepID=A0A8S5TYA1_9VIRU|nr:MAG TPA: hypothetical protein [Phage sp. ctHEp8]
MFLLIFYLFLSENWGIEKNRDGATSWTRTN